MKDNKKFLRESLGIYDYAEDVQAGNSDVIQDFAQTVCDQVNNLIEDKGIMSEISFSVSDAYVEDEDIIAIVLSCDSNDFDLFLEKRVGIKEINNTAALERHYLNVFVAQAEAQIDELELDYLDEGYNYLTEEDEFDAELDWGEEDDDDLEYLNDEEDFNNEKEADGNTITGVTLLSQDEWEDNEIDTIDGEFWTCTSAFGDTNYVVTISADGEVNEDGLHISKNAYVRPVLIGFFPDRESFSFNGNIFEPFTDEKAILQGNIGKMNFDDFSNNFDDKGCMIKAFIEDWYRGGLKENYFNFIHGDWSE